MINRFRVVEIACVMTGARNWGVERRGNVASRRALSTSSDDVGKPWDMFICVIQEDGQRVRHG